MRADRAGRLGDVDYRLVDRGADTSLSALYRRSVATKPAGLALVAPTDRRLTLRRSAPYGVRAVKEVRVRLMVPMPSDVVRFVSRAWQAADQVVGVVPRLVALLGQVEEIVRILRSIDDLDRRMVDAVDKTLSIIDRAEPIVAEFAPTLRLLHPIVRRLAESTDPDEVEAAVRLVNDLPELVAKIHADVLPTLTALGSVPDDLREVLVTAKELNEIIASVPGLGRMRQKAVRELSEQDHAARDEEVRAESEPPDRPNGSPA